MNLISVADILDGLQPIISADKCNTFDITIYQHKYIRTYDFWLPLSYKIAITNPCLVPCGLNSSVLISLLMCLHMIF